MRDSGGGDCIHIIFVKRRDRRGSGVTRPGPHTVMRFLEGMSVVTCEDWRGI